MKTDLDKVKTKKLSLNNLSNQIASLYSAKEANESASEEKEYVTDITLIE